MQVTTVGLDLAKDVFQVHGVDAFARQGLEIAHFHGRSASTLSIISLPFSLSM